MATSHHVNRLFSEVTCSICLDFFQEPVALECEHNFCRLCISKSWEQGDAFYSCPECREEFREKKLRPNRMLANIVEGVRELNLQPHQGHPTFYCQQHEERRKLFCQDCQAAICVVCSCAKEHRGHSFIPVEEAADLYKDLNIKTLEEIYLFSLPIKESEIIDFFLGSALKDEVLKIVPIQKQICAGQHTRIKGFVAIESTATGPKHRENDLAAATTSPEHWENDVPVPAVHCNGQYIKSNSMCLLMESADECQASKNSLAILCLACPMIVVLSQLKEKLEEAISFLQSQKEKACQSQSQEEAKICKVREQGKLLKEQVEADLVTIYQFLDTKKQELETKIEQQVCQTIEPLQENVEKIHQEMSSIEQTVLDVQLQLSFKEPLELLQ
eukprot:g47919.t1